MNYNKVNAEFVRNAEKTYENNTDYYSDNDINYLKKMNQMYGCAMSVKGLNVLDPIYANFFHYNKTGMLGNVDYPRVTKTYAFFTRPELNFSFENIQAVPFFKWLYSKKIGKMIMASLTDPEYFINAPSTLNSKKLTSADIRKVIDEFVTWFRNEDKEFIKDAGYSEEYQRLWNENAYNNSGGYEQALNELTATDADGNPVNSILSDEMNKAKEAEAMDDAAERERLMGLDFGTLYDSAKLESLNGQLQSISARYNAFYANYEGHLKSGFKSGLLQDALNLDNTKNLTHELVRMGLFQGKSILMPTHKSKYDTFNFTSPFIPLLGNTCTQVTGAKDMTLDSHTYEEDEFGKTLQVATGMDSFWGPGSLTTNFNDIGYGPVSLLFMAWIMYIHYVSRGYIMTTRDHVLERILDYTCSVYVFMVGEDGRRIERWCKFTGCYPTTFNLGSQIEHNTSIDQDILQKVTINWAFNDFEAMDPQTFTDFNFLSETEWLVKLKNVLWENLYDRSSATTKELKRIADEANNALSQGVDDYERQFLDDIKRPASLWDRVKDPGMSGKLPAALIEADERDSIINHVNSVWGGFPYVNKGSELIWVLPQYTERQGVVRDQFPNSGSVDNYTHDAARAVYDQEARKAANSNKEGSTRSTGWDHGRNSYTGSGSNSTAKDVKNYQFIGNATLV